MFVTYNTAKSLYIFALMCCQVSMACGPGRGGLRRRAPRKLTPLVYKEYVPNMEENSPQASGPSTGAIGRLNRHKFRKLVPNYNSDIIFKDEEGTGADRLMTQRLKEKLSILSISVMNMWPGVKLRVTEAWDEDGMHAPRSLHYEGRAVDITTSDRDRSKYGMLARLAVEAGFDWVYYEARSHIHCSVKTDEDGKAGRGCFDGTSMVETRSNGTLSMRQLQVGDEVRVLDPVSGESLWSPVIAFLDRDSNAIETFQEVTTEEGNVITLTSSHLISSLKKDKWQTKFASRLLPGDIVRSINPCNRSITKKVRIKAVRRRTSKGLYAPLTMQGNLFVNNISASCYAYVESEYLAHIALFPLRLLQSVPAQDGVHWYANLLQALFSSFLTPITAS